MGEPKERLHFMMDVDEEELDLVQYGLALASLVQTSPGKLLSKLLAAAAPEVNDPGVITALVGMTLEQVMRGPQAAARMALKITKLKRQSQEYNMEQSAELDDLEAKVKRIADRSKES